MKRLYVFAFACLAAALPQSALRAQGDPVEEIKEIARSIDEQLREIDRLLLESGKKEQQRRVPKDLLQQARDRGQAVEDGIDKLIEKLNEMKGKGGGGGGSQNESQQSQPQDGQQGQGQDGQPQDQRQQGQPGARRENQTPDYVQQPQQGEQQGGQEGQGQKPQPQGQQPGGQEGGKAQPNGQPGGGPDSPSGGQNQPGSKPPGSETGPGQPGTGEGSWGELQPYLNFLRNRGATPQVQEKYRKYYEAYLKNKRSGGK